MRKQRRHGYDFSPGTIYPIARKKYFPTKKGREVLSPLRKQVEELYRDIVRGGEEEWKECKSFTGASKTCLRVGSSALW